MPAADLTVIVVNLALAALAAALAAWSAFRGMIVFRPLHAAVSMLAVIYCVSYVWLLSNYGGTEPVATWSKVMRGVSIAAWPTVWMAQSVISVRIHRAVQHAAERLDRLAVEARADQRVADES